MRLVKAKANPSCSTGSNLDRLIADLKTIPKGASLQQRMDRIRQHPIHARDVWRHVYQDTGSYHREIIETNALFQLLIITWLPGQKSPIHNHRDSQCIVRVLSGFAIETVYLPRTGGAFSSEASIYKQGESFGGEDDDIHTLENQPTAAKPLVTLHAYFPPLRQMDLFRVKEGELKMVGPE
jgi:cysteine dioxygenase